jgi:thiamine kinase-like enzyme
LISNLIFSNGSVCVFPGLEQDYEYASYNPVAFDIANHFCEMTADYHSDEPHVLHPETFPSEFDDALLVSSLIFLVKERTSDGVV